MGQQDNLLGHNKTLDMISDGFVYWMSIKYLLNCTPEAGADRVVYVKHVGPPAPGVRVEDTRGAVAVREDSADRPLDFEEAEERGKARSAVQPHDDWGLGSLLLLLYRVE